MTRQASRYESGLQKGYRKGLPAEMEKMPDTTMARRGWPDWGALPGRNQRFGRVLAKKSALSGLFF